MVESKYWKEQNAVAIALTEARVKVSQSQEHLLEVLVERFGSSPFHENLIKQIDDLERLKRMRKVQLTATSWDAVIAVE